MKKIIIVTLALALVAGAVSVFLRKPYVSQPVDSPIVSNSSEQPASSTGVDENGSPLPRIDSVSSAKARIGDQVEIRGLNFSGFEGDKYAWIEDDAGKAGIIYGDTSIATNTYIRFKLESRYCTVDTSYSGAECASYLDIVPGKYKIFVKPWAKTSNKVDLEVVASPVIKILSPKGGEVYKQGDQIEVRWSDVHAISGLGLLLYVVDEKGEKSPESPALSKGMGPDLTSPEWNGVYRWQLSETMLPGRYKILVAPMGKFSADISSVTSDGYFSVIKR